MANKINILQKEPNNQDKALSALLFYAKNVPTKTKENIQNILADQLMKEHTIAIVELENKKCCPRCNGVQPNLFNGNEYHCPYCGQKIQDVEVGKDGRKVSNLSHE